MQKHLYSRDLCDYHTPYFYPFNPHDSSYKHFYNRVDPGHLAYQKPANLRLPCFKAGYIQVQQPVNLSSPQSVM